MMCRVTMDEMEVSVTCECGLSQVVMDISAALSWCANEIIRHGIGKSFRMEIVLAIDASLLPGLFRDGTGPAIV